MKNYYHPFFFILLMIILFSCKPVGSLYKYPYYYTVINHTSYEIKIYFKTKAGYYGYYYGQNTIPDTITFLLPGQEKILIAYENSNFRNPETGEIISNLDTIQAYIDDTIVSGRNLMQTKYWHFTETADDAAKLLLYISDEDFK